MKTRPWRATLFWIMGLLFGLPALAADWSGTRSIVLSNAAGERHTIGQVVFSEADQGKTVFRIEMAANMQDYFLAMRPFLCLTGPVQRLC